ncbi:multicopper oxidase family protein [Bradyrhizobium glycinis]|uniref:multicopper oxidase family protein n=1 Tax=Bradyrhizobium glycinis TaxID=2751812 RepID=UPI0018D5B8FF|nr:multicopper oxidase domain-containing protein [Bradyrhizobium glycinis]MBH5369492.1 multicopper oxidase domain-containing protein [Bradyrhizobium glycinis]
MARKIRPESTPPDDLFPEGIEDGGLDAYLFQQGRLEQALRPVGVQDFWSLGRAALHHHGHHSQHHHHCWTAKPCGPGEPQPVRLLDPLAQPRFVNDLPLPERIDTSRPGTVVLQMKQAEQWLGLVDANGEPLVTTVWGYGQPGHTATYPGPTLVAHAGTEIHLNWQNKLPLEGHLLPVDMTLHWAASDKKPLKDGHVPTVTHLHGAHVPSGSDGLPEQWFTQNYSSKGPDFESRIYTYPNDQDAATLWYHDHALGLTRLNVYAGLAGFYLLRDEDSEHLVSTGVLPGGSYEIEAVIQDRAFTVDGQLYFPAYKNDPLPGTTDTVGDVVPQSFYDANGENAPSAVPEFFGDHILVNGMAWPNLNVAAGDYEFHLLNGSDSRFYVLKLSDPDVKAYLVGVDGGLLPQAKMIMDGDGIQEDDEFLVLAPGDRIDVVFDFSGANIDPAVQLLNIGPAYEPFKGLAGPDGSLAGEAVAATSADPVGSIMQFTIDPSLATFDGSVTDGTVLAPNFHFIAQDSNEDGIADLATNMRKLGLFEGVDEFGRIEPMLGTAEAGAVHSDTMTPDGAFGPLMWDAAVTEKPLLGSIEQWELFNFTEDAHPIHLHQTQFQVVEKRLIDFKDADENGIPDDTNGDGVITYGSGGTDFSQNDIWIGDRVPIAPEQSGRQDTVYVAPGEMMSVVAEFDLPGEFVWHCHILSHEDHEMMRPYQVVESGWIV